MEVPKIGGGGYLTKEDLEKVIKNYIAPALNGMSLALEQLQKEVDELEKTTRKIDVVLRVERTASEMISKETKVGGTD